MYRIGFSDQSCVGRYCSRECQTSDFSEHKSIHKMIKKCQKTPFLGGLMAIVLALNEVKARSRADLPKLSVSSAGTGTLSVLLVGCRDYVEGSMDYAEFLTALQSWQIFDSADDGNKLGAVNITLCGPETSTKYRKTLVDGRVFIEQKQGRLEYLYPSADAIASQFSCIAIFQPGLSDYLQSWQEAMQLIIRSGVLTVTTGYSHFKRWSMDAIFDERVLVDYLGARVLLSMQRNPAACLTMIRNGVVQFAFFIAFRGASDRLSVDSVPPSNSGSCSNTSSGDGTSTVFYQTIQSATTESTDASPSQQISSPRLLSYPEIMRWIRIAFLKFVGSEAQQFEDRPAFGVACLELAQDIENGKLTVPIHIRNTDLERMAEERSWHGMV